MDDNFLNKLYESAKIKNKEIYDIEQESRELKKIEKYDRIEAYRMARDYARKIDVLNLLKNTLTMPSEIDGLTLPLILSSPKNIIPVKMGILIEAAYSGSYSAADRLDMLYRNNATSASDYVSNDEINEIRIAIGLYGSNSGSIKGRSRCGVKDEKILEILIKKLNNGLERNDPFSFFALAQITLWRSGHIISKITDNVVKAYKLYSVAEMLAHPDAARSRKILEDDFPELLTFVQSSALFEKPENKITIDHENNENFFVAEQKNSTKYLVLKECKFQNQRKIVNSEQIYLGMMKEEPYCTVISSFEGTAIEWLSTLPCECHLLYSGIFQRENNTVERYVRLINTNGYPTKADELSPAPANVAIDSLLIATYQLGAEHNHWLV